MSPSAGANLPTVGFQHRTDAERFLKEFLERLAKFGLELHPGKTRLIEFGRFAARNRRQRRGKTRDLHVPGVDSLLWAAHPADAFTVWIWHCRISGAGYDHALCP
jgi:hypothetical protein